MGLYAGFIKVESVRAEPIVDISDVQEPADVEAMKVAVEYVEQWRLAQWTEGVNVAQGVAPGTEKVLEQAAKRRALLPELVRPRDLGTASETASRIWAPAWRRRCGGRVGRIRIRDDVPVADLQNKVSPKT